MTAFQKKHRRYILRLATNFFPDELASSHVAVDTVYDLLAAVPFVPLVKFYRTFGMGMEVKRLGEDDGRVVFEQKMKEFRKAK